MSCIVTGASVAPEYDRRSEGEYVIEDLGRRRRRRWCKLVLARALLYGQVCISAVLWLMFLDEVADRGVSRNARFVMIAFLI